MIPIRLIIKNFKCYSFADLDFTIAQSFCVVGSSKNNQNESNGTGKSTIFEAIRFVLFGEYDGKTINNIIRNDQDSAEVSFDFELDKIYRVQRIRTKKNSFLSFFEKNPDESWKDISGRTAPDTESKLRDIIKINHVGFCNSKYFSQKDSKILSLARTPSDRRKILKEVLNLTIYSTCEKNAREQLNEIEKELAITSSLIQNFNNPKQKLLEINSKLESDSEKLISLNNKKINLENKLNIIQNSIHTIENQLNPNKHWQDSLNELKIQKRNYQLSLNNSNKTLTAKIKEYEINKSSIEDKNKQLQEFKDELEQLKKKKIRDENIINIDLSSFNSSIITLKSEIISFEEKLNKLKTPIPSEDVCPACRQPLTKDHFERCSFELQKEISITENELNNKNLKLKELEKNNEKLKNELKEIVDVKNKINTLLSKIESKKEEIKNALNALKQISHLIDKVKEDNSFYQKNIDDLTKKELEIQHNYNEKNIEEKQLKLQDLKKEFDSLNKDSVFLIQQISKLETNICFHNNEIKNLNNSVKELEIFEKKSLDLTKSLNIQRETLEAFKPSGIPTDIIHTILDDFQIETSQAIKELRPEMDIKISIDSEKSEEEEDTLDFKYFIHGKEIDQYHLSEGQQFTASWGFRRGLGAVQEKRLGYELNFLLLDEIDQPLDKKTLEFLVQMLNQLQNKYKIIIITHNDWIKSKFNNYIQVEYDDVNGSTAKIISV